MAAIAAPLPPVHPWWEPAKCQRVTADSAGSVLACLERLPSSIFFIGRLAVPAVLDPSVANEIPERHAAQRVLPYLWLNKFHADDIRIGQVLDQCGNPYVYANRVSQGTWSPTLLFTCLSTRPVEEVTGRILQYCQEKLVAHWRNRGRRGESWRQLTTRGSKSRTIITGEPLAVEIVSGPHMSVLAEPEVKPLAVGFEVDFQTNLEQAARSTGAEQLLQILEMGFGDVGVRAADRVSALHLAALTGDVAVVSAVVARVVAAEVGQLAWQDADGRTPLHCAALFDSAELVQALLSVCDAAAEDRWGRTALDVATDLDHHAAAAVLQGSPWSLKTLSSQKARQRLHNCAADAETLHLLRTTAFGDLIPLHDYRAWSTLAADSSEVDPSITLRSMSCLECWYADAFNRKCSAALPSHMELIRVWDDVSSFQPPLESTESQLHVAVLAEAPGPRKAPTVADRATFLKRFHARTGGVFDGFDWSNVLMIGGMVLACLVADDEEYARDFGETDVDLYIVGAGLSEHPAAGIGAGRGGSDLFDYNDKIRGEFHACVSRIMESLPGTPASDDHRVRLSGPLLEKHKGEPGVLFEPDRVNNRLVITSTTAALAECCPQIEPGDFILGVNDEDTVEGMIKALASRQRPERWGMVLIVRPAAAERASTYASVVRTPQTLTACVRRRSGEPLPNVQVVLAPYSSPAHLLFTTDIDCTAMGFDGEQLFTTPRAREAIRHRRNIARPERYMVRGEWRSEARLLKYAARGFRVVDLGLRPEASPVLNGEVASIAQEALGLLGAGNEADEASNDADGAIMRCVRRVRSTGVHGAQLLLLAAREEGLRRLLLHESPLLPAGLGWDRLVELVTTGKKRSSSDDEGSEDEGTETERSGGDGTENLVHYNDGYGKAAAALVLVNPAKAKAGRVGDRELRGFENSLSEAIVALDLESDRFEVHNWYHGVEAGGLRDEHAALDPAVWKGVGDFRSAD